jgi:predicted dehydrogenase
MRLTGSFTSGGPVVSSAWSNSTVTQARSRSAASGFRRHSQYGPFGGEYAPVPLVREPYRGIAWGRGVADLARSIVEGTPQRITGEHAAHVVDILSAARRSMRKRRRVEIESTFAPPPLMEWAARG